MIIRHFPLMVLFLMAASVARADLLMDAGGLSREQSAAVPGDVAVPVAEGRVLEVVDWATQASDENRPGVYTLRFKTPTEVGAVLAYDGGEMAYEVGGAWKPLPLQPGRRLVVIPLPAGVRVDAIRLTVPARLARKLDPKAPTYESALPFLALLTPRVVNAGVEAAIVVSSAAPPSQGFQPQPWLNRPETLVDGFVDGRQNFFTAKRDADLTPESPEWVLLAWDDARPIHGLALMRGASEKGVGQADIEVCTVDVDPRFATDPVQWKKVSAPLTAPGNFRAIQYADFGQPVRARGLRIRATGGVSQIGLGEVVVFADAAAVPAIAAAPRGVVPIPFNIPGPGKVTIQIRDREGKVVANPITGVEFPAGRNTAYWNLDDVVGKPVLQPGEYRWHGLYVPGLRVDYKHTYFPYPLAHVAWQTADGKGGWLADHEPPRTIARSGDTMWLGAFAEAGDSIVQTDADANKLWGTDRVWVAIPAEICTDGEWYYGWCEGGWIKDNQAIIQINTKTRQSRKIFQREMPGKDASDEQMRQGEMKRGVTGFQVIGNLAFVSFGKLDVIQVFDISKGLAASWRGFGWDIAYKQFEDQKPVLVKQINLPTPGRLRRYGERIITTSGADIVTIDLKNYAVQTLIAGKLRNPLGLAADDRGNVYVGEGAPLHQVFGYSPAGALIATIGKPGGREVGPFDVDNLENPMGVEVGPDGRIWVMEHSEFPKRVSLWDAKSGNCTKSIYGPTQYGGGGCLDPADENRLFYHGMEFRRDPATGTVTPVNLYYRTDSARFARFSSSDYPEYAFRAEGKLWMTSFMWPHGHPLLVLWQYKETHVMPVAAIGSAVALRETFGEKAGKKGDQKDWQDTSSLVKHIPGYRPDEKFFTWADLNDDGFVQPGELKFAKLEHQGRLLNHASAGWNWRMNEKFEAAANAGNGRMIFFKPAGRTRQGYPTYEVPATTVAGNGEALMPDSRGNAIVLGGPLSCVEPDGTVRWTYRNDWPGLHAGHSTTARGDEPGVLIAPTRIWGIARASESLGDVVAFNSNLGCTYLMTTDDGLFIDRVFRDQRVGLLWRMSAPPTPEVLAETSLYDEHFGGTFQKARSADGKDRFYYICGKNHSSVVELTGLEQIQRLAGTTLTVTAAQVAKAQEERQLVAARTAQPKVYTITRAKPGAITIDGDDREWPADRIDGFALAHDTENLYVMCKTKDDRAAFENRGANPLEMFKTGDVVDVMLQTRVGLKPSRTEAGPGDIRLSFAMFEGKPICVLYDFRIDGFAGQRVPFSSPWRTVWCDRVEPINARVQVTRRGGEFIIEAAVPLKSIHLNPALLKETRGDVGRVASDQTGSAAASRTYWANKHTAIMSDLPSEAALQPNLWGLFRFAE